MMKLSNPLKSLTTANLIVGSMLALLSTSSFATPTNATNTTNTDIQINQPWAHSTVAGQKVTGVFMQLNAQKDSKLVAVSSPAAARAEIHQMTMDDQHVMRMRAMKSLDLPAGENVELKPGSYHIMLFDVKKQLKKDDEISLTLKFADKVTSKGKNKTIQTITIKVPVLDGLKTSTASASSSSSASSMQEHLHGKH